MAVSRLVIEWTRTSVRVGVAEGKVPRAQLRAVHTQILRTSDELPGALHSLVKGIKGPPPEVICTLPREQVITRLVRFPSLQRAELAQMVSLYAKGQLPYPSEQTVVDFSVVQSREGFSTVAIVACPSEVVERQLAHLHQAGISATLLTVSSWGVLNWYSQANARGGGQPSDGVAPEPVVVINVDDTRTDLILIEQGRLLTSRSMGQGILDWGDAQEVANLLALEAERTVAAVQKELPGTETRSVVLTGLGPLDEWKQRITQHLGLPVTVIEGTRLGKGKVELTTPSTHISSVVVAGLATAPLQGLLNLNPPHLRAKRKHRSQFAELVQVGGLLVAVLVMGALLLVQQRIRQQKFARQLSEIVKIYEPQAKTLRQTQRTTQFIDATLKQRQNLAAVLAGIMGEAPPGVMLERMAFERSRQELVLRGHTGSTQLLLQYAAQLEELNGIRKADLKYSRQRSGPQGEQTEFELLLRL